MLPAIHASRRRTFSSLRTLAPERLAGEPTVGAHREVGGEDGVGAEEATDGLEIGGERRRHERDLVALLTVPRQPGDDVVAQMVLDDGAREPLA